MRADEVRRQVFAAIERGEIPRGAPSELRALGLTDEVPAGYWEGWGRDAAARIRGQVAAVVCRCELGPLRNDDGRCGRCYGRTDL